MPRRRKQSEPRALSRPVVEPLEQRLLLSAAAPTIIDFAADNRGLIELTASADLVGSTVNADSVRVFEAGDDGLLGTGDDVQVFATVTYLGPDRLISADADVTPDAKYRVVLDASVIRGANGRFLDGEFNGVDAPSGDGQEGGDLEFFTRQAQTLIVTMRTNAGDIRVEMFPDATPLTVENFFFYMNNGDYDTTFFHRSAKAQDGTPFVIQGGGFTSNIGLDRIPAVDPVQNEPGISNTRGTIAMAKLGGDPNSATNQFFFNNGDNSGNLDEQNGGFTVFGRILDDEGLAVMDAISAFDTVDATDSGGAFGELPVLDADAVNDRGGAVFPSDLIKMSRVSAGMDIVAEPFQQLPTGEVVTISADSGDARVVLYSLTDRPLGDIDEFLSVKFGSDGVVSSVRLTANPPEPIGVQITGVTSVGSFVDARRSPDSDLAFLVSDAAIRSISVKGVFEGYNLNNVLLSNNVLLPDDVDGDGDLDDATAIYLADGGVRSLTLRDDLNGSIVIPQGADALTVRGDLDDADLVLGESQTRPSVTLRLGEVLNSSLSVGTPVATLRAESWQDRSGVRSAIQAPSIRSLNITGSRDTAGDFGPSVRLTGTTTIGPFVLAGANIKGDVLASSWTLAGDLGNLNIRGDTVNWSIDVIGNARLVKVDAMFNSAVEITGSLNKLSTREWIDGALSAASVRVIDVRGGGGYDGDLNAFVELGADGRGVSTDRLRVRGDLRDSDISLQGSLRGLSIKGDVERSNLSAFSMPKMRFNSVVDSEIVYRSGSNDLVADEWIGGRVEGPSLRGVRIAGDFRADLLADNVALLRVGGDLEGDVQVFQVPRVEIGGDVVNAQVTLTQFDPDARAVSVMTVGGMVMNSDIRVQGIGGVFSFGAMFDSNFHAGVNADVFGFPDAGVVNPAATIERVTVRGMGDGHTAFANSVIAAGEILYARITNPELNNSGRAIGVGAFSIGAVDVYREGERPERVVRPTDPVRVAGDLEVRPEFRAPA